MLIAANPDQFAGCWIINDDGNDPSNDAYEQMMAQMGLPKNTEHYSYADKQHLVGGKRIEGRKFAVTSLFKTMQNGGNSRVPTAVSVARQERANKAYAEAVDYRTPAIGQFDLGNIRSIAKELAVTSRPVKSRK